MPVLKKNRLLSKGNGNDVRIAIIMNSAMFNIHKTLKAQSDEWLDLDTTVKVLRNEGVGRHNGNRRYVALLKSIQLVASGARCCPIVLESDGSSMSMTSIVRAVDTALEQGVHIIALLEYPTDCSDSAVQQWRRMCDAITSNESHLVIPDNQDNPIRMSSTDVLRVKGCDMGTPYGYLYTSRLPLCLIAHNRLNGSAVTRVQDMEKFIPTCFMAGYLAIVRQVFGYLSTDEISGIMKEYSNSEV